MSENEQLVDGAVPAATLIEQMTAKRSAIQRAIADASAELAKVEADIAAIPAEWHSLSFAQATAKVEEWFKSMV